MTQMERGLDALRVCVLSHFSCVPLFATPGTEVHQVSLSKGFTRQEYWRRLPCPPPGGSSLLQGIFPPPGDLPDSGIEPESLTSPALAGRVFTTDHLGGLFGPLTDLISSPVPSLPGALESGLWELLVPSVFLQLQIFISVISP